MRVVDVKPGSNSVQIPVSADWGAGRLCRRARASPARRRRQAHARPRLGVAWFGIDKAAHQIEVSLGTRPEDAPARAAGDPHQARGPRGGRGGLRHRRGGRCRHPQPDALRVARPRRLLLRPAAALRRSARPLRIPDRRHAGRPRRDPLRRRRRRPHGRRDPADAGAGRPLFRRGQGWAGRHGEGLLRHPRLQRHAAGDGRGLDARAAPAAPPPT